MASQSQYVEVGSRSLEISNLEKVLFPGEGISKAEIIHYYLSVAPTLLYHIRGRPLTLIRYPDGITAQRFYQKNTPEWAPEWIDQVSLGKEKKKDYVMADEPAALAWLANLAALELHQMHSRKPEFGRPDYMVFDLDPPEDSGFDRVVETALHLKKHVEEYDYHPFVKTTGGKGVHLVIPLEPQAEMDQVFEVSRKIAQEFVDAFPDETTLQIKKNARKGRILIDIYRNRARQTIVSPYSLRGKETAPVSMPLTWEELQQIDSSREYHIRNAEEYLRTSGDAWEGIGGYAATLHTLRGEERGYQSLPGSMHVKSPEELTEYSKKRDFSRSPEPAGSTTAGGDNRFVLHRHHATRLHYDLRLEQEGVLRSWAVPKGLPQRPGIKRLAVQTEDHPMEYLDFEGQIPKQEYGGGDMWIFVQGRYRITKQKKNGFYFFLDAPGLSGEFRLHKMKEDQWLLEKVDPPKKEWLQEGIPPMHGELTDAPPAGDYLYEVKWDGIRAMITLEEGGVRIRSRNLHDITEKFPELQQHAADALQATCGVFDGEIVVLDENGRPSFQAVLHRLKSSGESNIQKMAQTHPVHCYLFDCLYLDGRAIVGEPFVRRHEWLADAIRKGTPFRLSETVAEGASLFQAAQEHDLEGIMAKKTTGRYLPGKRSNLWQKVKVQKSTDCYVIGYTPGKGDRQGSFGALHLAEKSEQEWTYRGKVGTGFDRKTLQEVYEELEKMDKVEFPGLEHLPADASAVWVRPRLIIEITYGRLSDNGLFKEAVFVGMRPDLVEEPALSDPSADK